MSERDPLIALDAMGGDNAPGVTVAGAVEAARDLDVRVALVGRPEVIVAELAKHGGRPEKLSVIPASEVIEMDEQPAKAARQKKDSSIVAGLRLVKQGEADAFVSAGALSPPMASRAMIGSSAGIAYSLTERGAFRHPDAASNSSPRPGQAERPPG